MLKFLSYRALFWLIQSLWIKIFFFLLSERVSLFRGKYNFVMFELIYIYMHLIYLKY